MCCCFFEGSFEETRFESNVNVEDDILTSGVSSIQKLGNKSPRWS